MIAVSNTTPLRYLIAIGHQDLLPQLFEKVFVPRAVHEELTEARTPHRVRDTVLSLPAWYQIREVSETTQSPFPLTLHRGERHAILLAEQIKADLLLIDDYVGRTIATDRNLPLSGTLGVLERADSMGFIRDFPSVLDSLKAGGFFVAESLRQQLILRHKARRASKI